MEHLDQEDSPSQAILGQEIPPVAPVANENAAAAAAAAEAQLLDTPILEMAKKYRVLIPFLLLLFIKLILDNSVPFIFISFATVGIIKIKNQLDLQIALKIKSNTNMFVYLLCASMFLLLMILGGIQMSGLPDHSMARLLLSYERVKDKPKASFLRTLWCCLLMDSLIQSATLITKCIACLCIGSQSFQCSSLKNLLKYEFWRDMTRFRTTSASAPSASVSNSFDVENQQRPTGQGTTTASNGGNGVLTQELLSQLITNFSRQNSFSSGIMGLARRSNSNASNTPITTGASSAGGASSNYQHNYTPIIHDHDSDTPSHDPQESQEYLKRIRLCSLLDIVFFVYRTVVPIAAWVDYFSSGGMGSTLLFVLYFIIKLCDLIWKFQASVVGIKNYFTQTLEYGHYSTPEEYPTAGTNTGVNASHTSLQHMKECPVCFDTPITRPITLDCNHIFCEICILEWLDKEKTCPICRAEVKCVSPLVGTLKEDIANSTFLVT